MKLKHLEVSFTSDGKQNKEIDTWIGIANTVMRTLEHYVTKRELINTATFLVVTQVCVKIITYSMVMSRAATG